MRSPNLYGDPTTVLSVYAYDAEDHADEAIFEYLKGKGSEEDYEGDGGYVYELVLAGEVCGEVNSNQCEAVKSASCVFILYQAWTGKRM